MMSLKPVKPEEICKICEAAAPLVGTVDFNRHGEPFRGPDLPDSGVRITYHRCSSCGYLFSCAFDDWSKADFRANIYNRGYALLDPDSTLTRPGQLAERIADAHGDKRALTRILDYGAGLGMLAYMLSEMGFTDVSGCDPLYDDPCPARYFDLIVASEVAEYVPGPHEMLTEITSRLASGGQIWLTVPPIPDTADLDWWRVAPRIGRIGLFTEKALDLWLDRHGLARLDHGSTFLHCLERIPTR